MTEVEALEQLRGIVSTALKKENDPPERASATQKVVKACKMKTRAEVLGALGGLTDSEVPHAEWLIGAAAAWERMTYLPQAYKIIHRDVQITAEMQKAVTARREALGVPKIEERL